MFIPLLRFFLTFKQFVCVLTHAYMLCECVCECACVYCVHAHACVCMCVCHSTHVKVRGHESLVVGGGSAHTDESAAVG